MLIHKIRRQKSFKKVDFVKLSSLIFIFVTLVYGFYSPAVNRLPRVRFDIDFLKLRQLDFQFKSTKALSNVEGQIQWSNYSDKVSIGSTPFISPRVYSIKVPSTQNLDSNINSVIKKGSYLVIPAKSDLAFYTLLSSNFLSLSSIDFSKVINLSINGQNKGDYLWIQNPKDKLFLNFEKKDSRQFTINKSGNLEALNTEGEIHDEVTIQSSIRASNCWKTTECIQFNEIAKAWVLKDIFELSSKLNLQLGFYYDWDIKVVNFTSLIFSPGLYSPLLVKIESQLPAKLVQQYTVFLNNQLSVDLLKKEVQKTSSLLGLSKSESKEKLLLLIKARNDLISAMNQDLAEL